MVRWVWCFPHCLLVIIVLFFLNYDHIPFFNFNLRNVKRKKKEPFPFTIKHVCSCERHWQSTCFCWYSVSFLTLLYILTADEIYIFCGLPCGTLRPTGIHTFSPVGTAGWSFLSSKLLQIPLLCFLRRDEQRKAQWLRSVYIERPMHGGGVEVKGGGSNRDRNRQSKTAKRSEWNGRMIF